MLPNILPGLTTLYLLSLSVAEVTDTLLGFPGKAFAEAAGIEVGIDGFATAHIADSRNKAKYHIKIFFFIYARYSLHICFMEPNVDNIIFLLIRRVKL